MSGPPPYSEHDEQTQYSQPMTVITQQPATQTVVLHTVQVGPGPSLMTCPNCLATVTTIIDFEISGRTHLCAIGLCLIGCWPCIPIPYFCCGGCCQRTVHSCPNCKQYVGSF